MKTEIYIENIKKTQYGFTHENGMAAITFDDNHLKWPNMYRPHSHHMLEVSLIASGTGIYKIGDKSYNIHAGDIYVINNTEVHNIILKEGEEVDNLVIHFETSFLWNFYGQAEEVQFLDVFFNRHEKFSHRLDFEHPAAKEIASLFRQMQETFVSQPPYYKLRVKILLESILYQILCSYGFHDSDPRNTKALSNKDLYKISEIMNYINFHLDSHLTLPELAKIACISPAYFSSIFKRYNGITLFEYITKKRVDYAIQLIKTTNKSLTDIAISCGFNSSTSFNKAFGRVTGFPPSSYRKKDGSRDT